MYALTKIKLTYNKKKYKNFSSENSHITDIDNTLYCIDLLTQ